MTLIVLLLVLLILAAVFALQNAAPVSVVFLFWGFEAPLAVVFFLSALGGAIAVTILYYIVQLRKRLKSGNRAKETEK